MNIRSLRDGEQDACLDLWDAAFSSTPRTFFEKYFTDPNWRFDDTVVCDDFGQLTSAVHFVRRTVETRDGRRTMAGIANVGTHPDFRGGGRSTACLSEAIRRMESDPTLDFSLLGTGIPDFYARLGWRPWDQRCFEGDNPFLGRQHSHWQSRPAADDDLENIAKWHSEHNKNRPLSVVRNEAYWRNWGGWTPQNTFVTDNGYARFVDRDGIRSVLARTEGFPWHEAFGDAPRIRLCVALENSELNGVLDNPEPIHWGGWMVRPLGDKPLPDMANGAIDDLDGF